MIKKLRQKTGAALITVLVAMMIISILLLEFQYAAMVERKIAYNDLNQLQAYYLAKAGVRVGLLRISMYARARRDPNLKKISGIDVKPYLEMIWNLPLPAFPPATAGLAKLNKADKDAAEKVLEQTQISDGQYTTVITSEASKINLNFLQVPEALANNPRIDFNPPLDSLFKQVGYTLISMIDNFMKDSDDPYEEFGNVKPEEIVYNLMDWVNPGANSYAGGTKDSWYEQQSPPYKAKRGRFYTLDEVRLVKGMEDRLFATLKPHITVYSYDGRINLNQASTEMYRAIYRDFTEDDLKKIFEEKTRLGGNWQDEGQFVRYVTETLGRSGFKTLYSDPNNYPFTVASQSFLIESMGVIRKSKSQIQKIIRVGVALTRGRGSSRVPNKTQADCVKDDNQWWDDRQPPGECKIKPTNQEECTNEAGGRWDTATRCCPITGTVGVSASKNVCLTSGGSGSSTAGGASRGTGAGIGNPANVEPNTLRILYWSET